MITQLSDSKKLLRGLSLLKYKLVQNSWLSEYISVWMKLYAFAEISIATTSAEGTIKNAYKDLYGIASKIIPEWYAKGKDFKNLANPKA